MYLLAHLSTIVVPPPLQGRQFAATSIGLVPNVLLAGSVALYLWGVARNNRLHRRHPWSGWRTAAFLGGAATTWLAVETFIGVYDRVLFWDHMVQHLMLIMFAAGLFAVGSPVALLFRASTGPTHRRVVRALRSPVARVLGSPLLAFVGYALVIPLSHLTSFYNLTLVNGYLHDFEHLVFLFFGYLFWRQVFGIEPNCHRLHPALKMGYLFLSIPVDTFTGLSLNTTTTELFPAYTTMHRTWGPSPVSDLHIGGVIMWVVGDSLMMLAMIPVAVNWLRYEQRRAVRVDRELDRILPGVAERDPVVPARPAPTGAVAEPGRRGWRAMLPPSQAPPAAPPVA